jgi:hypothetical protein
MDPICDDLWFCIDCTIAHCNGDMPEDPDRAAEVEAGFSRLGGNPAMNDGEFGEGEQSFSFSECDCCGSTLGGSRHRFALFEATG